MVVFWDWNGTLLDDVDVALACDEIVMARYGYAGVTKEEYLNHFGFPVRDFYLRHGVRAEDYEKIAEDWNREYARLFPRSALRTDALAAMRMLRDHAFRQVILSATEQSLLDAQVARFPDLIAQVDHVQGTRDVYASSKVREACKLFEDMHCRAEHTFVIGDTLHDRETARALQCRSVLVEGGHQSAQRLRQGGEKTVVSLLEAARWILEVDADA